MQWVKMLNIWCLGNENVLHIHDEILISHLKEWHSDICKIDGTGDYYTKWNKPDPEKQMLCFNSYVKVYMYICILSIGIHKAYI